MTSENSNSASVTTNKENSKESDIKRSSSVKKSKLIKFGKKLLLPIINANNPVLKEIYKNKKEHGPLYLFTSEYQKVQKPRVNKNKKIIPSYLNMYEFENNNETQDYNVFNAQDNIIKDLMLKFYEKEKKKKVSKLIRRKNALNRLYDITPESNSRIIEAKKYKSLDLEDYQNNILTSVPAKCLEKGEMMDLVQSFHNLKYECDCVQPLPPINVKIIEDHVYKKNNSKSVKKMNLREFLGQSNEPKDDFEREQRIIKNLRSYKALPKFKRNKNYDFLPSYLRESLNKNLKFHL